VDAAQSPTEMETFKDNFLSIFRFFCALRFPISNSCISAKYCPILTNHTPMESLFSFPLDEKLTHKIAFVQGHSCISV